MQNNPKKLNITQVNCNTQHNHRKATSNQQTTVRSVQMCVCIALCTSVAHNTVQNRPDNFLFYPTNNVIAPMMYLREGGGCSCL